MPFVLDASTALNLILPEGTTPAGDAAAAAFSRGEVAHVPGLWVLEVANSCLVAERRQRIPTSAGDGLVENLLRLPIKVATHDFGVAAHVRQLLTLSREHRLTACDGAYLWLARELGLALATSDTELIRAAGAMGMSLSLLISARADGSFGQSYQATCLPSFVSLVSMR